VEVLLFFLLSAILNGFLPVYLPWWVFIPVNFLLAVFFRMGGKLSFWTGGLASGLVWLVYSVFISNANGHILAERTSLILQLPHPALLFAALFSLAFFLGGLAALAGVQFRNFITYSKSS
jgi:hypothetical protein